jgi:fructose-1,6-bisphosphatase/inositol monophosphatase family enzyme
MQTKIEPSVSEAWAGRLLSLGVAVQERLHQALAAGTEGLAAPVAQEGGDTIFAIDRCVEPIIESHLQQWPAEFKPVTLIAEGLGESGKRRFGREHVESRFRVLLDPIDGTRNLMYDKRSAWFIAAVAEDRGNNTCLKDAFAAVLVELPASKQAWFDAFTATRGFPARGLRMPVVGEGRLPAPLPLRPSLASNLVNGFGQVSNFFPGTKVLAAELMERIAESTVGSVKCGQALIFDDQYISTGGQMVELMVGHDRFCCDLRPLFYRILELQGGKSVRGLECHPYDIAGLLVAQNAGVIITDGWAGPLNCPFDVHTGVHWCGYANRALQEAIQPVILQWLREKGAIPNSPRL